MARAKKSLKVAYLVGSGSTISERVGARSKEAMKGAMWDLLAGSLYSLPIFSDSGGCVSIRTEVCFKGEVCQPTGFQKLDGALALKQLGLLGAVVQHVHTQTHVDGHGFPGLFTGLAVDDIIAQVIGALEAH